MYIQFTLKQKVIAWTLIFCLVITLIPELAFATANNYNNEELKGANDKQIIKKNERSTLYDRGKEKAELVLYGGQVRYEDSKGDIIDYIPSVPKEWITQTKRVWR